MKLYYWQFFKLFPSSKIDFWPFFKLQKMDFCQKIFCEIDLFDFTSFFGLDFLKFFGPLCPFLHLFSKTYIFMLIVDLKNKHANMLSRSCNMITCHPVLTDHQILFKYNITKSLICHVELLRNMFSKKQIQKTIAWCPLDLYNIHTYKLLGLFTHFM